MMFNWTRKLLVLILFVVGLWPVFLFAQVPESIRALVLTKDNDKLLAKLDEALEDSKSDYEKQYLFKFIKAKTFFEKGDIEPALVLFNELKENKHSLKLYVQYYRGQIYYRQGNYKYANAAFVNTLGMDPPRNIRNQSRYFLGLIALEQKLYRAAFLNFRYVERRWRGTFEHPEVMWQLVKAERGRHRRSRSCRWARKLYWKYPAFEKISHWDLNLRNNLYEGQKLYCSARLKDIKKRIRRLQWAGQSPRAREEIAKHNFGSTYTKDVVLAEFLINEGFVKEGLTTLSKYYSSKRRDYNFLMLFAKGTAKLSEFRAAIGLYYKAYQLSPRSRRGRKALFQAAFLSYQHQDYDGAIRKFDEFLKRFPRSSQSRDVKWYYSWSSYLKGDYSQALAGFKYIKKQKSKRRTRWRWRKISMEKVNYWMAMSYLRKGQTAKAFDSFQAIASDPLKGYYSYASQIRNESILQDTTVEKLLAMKNQEERRPSQAGGEVDEAVDESEQESEEESDDDEEEQEVADEDKDPNIIDDENDELKALKSRRLQNHFKNGSALAQCGFYDLAKWEFFEIERRTRKKSNLESLMEKYQQLGAYNRIAYIAQINFGSERGRHGMQGVKHLWEKAYPHAFNQYVKNYSKKFKVPEEFIWSIMRAESVYKAEIRSPVGARGLMQLMPHTAKQVSLLLGEQDFNADRLTEPEVNIRYGSRYLSRLGRKFKYTWPLVSAGYNAGPHRVYKWVDSFGHLEMDEFIEHIPFLETRRYVKKVTRFYSIYGELYNNKEAKPLWLAQAVNLDGIDGHTYRESWE